MENQPKELTVHPVSAEAARVALAPLMRLSTDSRNVSLDDMLAGASCFEVRADGKPVMHYVLDRVRRSNGNVDGFVLAAQGHCPGVDLTGFALDHIERQMADCDTLEIQTKRRGLGKKLARRGFHLGGVILRKNLK